VLFFIFKGKTMQPLNYIGNPDFRGYLSYMAKNPGAPGANEYSNANATAALQYAGNDGVLSNKQALTSSGDPLQAWTYPPIPAIPEPPTTANGRPADTPIRHTSTGSKVDPNFVNQAYDTKIAGLQSLMDTLDPQQDAAGLQVNNQYQNQSNALQSQQAQGHRNLDMAQNQVDTSKAHSLNDLRNQVATMGMSYNNQLGAYGAGDSSAAGMIQQALSGQASKNRSNVMNNAAQQGQAITMQGQDLDTEYQNNLKSLDDWKAASLNDVATKFLQQRQAIQQQMVGANADRYQALAQADASYTQQAIQQLSQLEGVYRQNAQDLVGRYQQMTAPGMSVNPALQQYAVQPITPGQLSGLSGIPQLQNDNGGYYVPRKFQEDYGVSLQPGF
jgi:hypothetical protein